MTLKCALRMAACLNFQGNAIPAETAVGILDSCDVIKNLSANEFRSENTIGKGNAWAALMYEDGLKFEYPPNPSPSQMKATVIEACKKFKSDFDTDSKWENLEKWPW